MFDGVAAFPRMRGSAARRHPSTALIVGAAHAPRPEMSNVLCGLVVKIAEMLRLPSRFRSLERLSGCGSLAAGMAGVGDEAVSASGWCAPDVGMMVMIGR